MPPYKRFLPDEQIFDAQVLDINMGAMTNRHFPIVFVFILVVSGCLSSVENTVLGESVTVTNENSISCSGWEDGRYWNINGERFLTDESCKGVGNDTINPEFKSRELEVGDNVEYIIGAEVNCQVQITQGELNRLEAICTTPIDRGKTSHLDSDSDGVLDSSDRCPNTKIGSVVNQIDGCSWAQLDDDIDGIVNDMDQCQNSVSDAIVDQSGCKMNSIAVIGSFHHGGVITNQFGETSQPRTVEMLGSGIVDVAISQNGYAALRSDGSVFVWSASNSDGEFLGHDGFLDVSHELNASVTSIHSDGNNFVALKSNGSVVAWGPDQKYFYSEISEVISPGCCGPTSLVGIIGNDLMFLRSDGSVITWGDFPINQFLREDVGSIIQEKHGSIVIKSDDSVHFVHADQDNRPELSFSPLPDYVNGSSISEFVTTRHSAAVLQDNGSLHILGYSEMFQNKTSNDLLIQDIEEVVANDGAILARDTHGKLYSWSTDDLTPRKQFEDEFITQIQIRRSGFSAQNSSGHWTHWGSSLSEYCTDENLNDTLNYTNLSQLFFSGRGCLAQTTSNEILLLSQNNHPSLGDWYNSTFPQNQEIQSLYCSESGCLFIGVDEKIFAWGSSNALVGFDNLPDLRVRNVYHNSQSFVIAFY